MNYYFFSFLDAIKNLPDPSKQKATNAIGVFHAWA